MRLDNAGLTQFHREPLWAIGLTAVLLATRLARRPVDPSFNRRGYDQLDSGRGRFAEGPSEIPARGWKDILWRVYDGISEDRILANAARVTFYALLALFPAIAALVSIYGLFADPATIVSHLDAMSDFAPGGAIEVLRDQLTRLAAQGGTTLGISFLIGLVVSLSSANSGIKALFDALNVVYEEKEERSFIKLNAVTLSFTIATIVFLLVALACVIVLPVALNYLPLPEVTELILKAAPWPILLVLIALALALIYRYGPSRTEPKWRWITWGSAFATTGWLAASALFSWYAANFGNFNKTYGSLGAIIGFMTWMWLSTIVVLVGGKLNAEIEHQTARESTSGPPKPLGRREARMADTIGPAHTWRIHSVLIHSDDSVLSIRSCSNLTRAPTRLLQPGWPGQAGHERLSEQSVGRNTSCTDQMVASRFEGRLSTPAANCC